MYNVPEKTETRVHRGLIVFSWVIDASDRGTYLGGINLGASRLLSLVPASTAALRNGQALAVGIETPAMVCTPTRQNSHTYIRREIATTNGLGALAPFTDIQRQGSGGELQNLTMMREGTVKTRIL